MNWKILLTLLGAFLWWWLGDWFITCKLKQYCYGCAPTETVAPPPAQSYAPLTFNLNDPNALTTDGFPAVKDSILAGNTTDNLLEITGYYFKDEPIPDGFANMGEARAAKTRDLFAGAIPEERIVLKGQLVSDRTSADQGRFASADFAWTKIDINESKVTVTSKGTVILFPFNQSIKDNDARVDEYLSRLAEELKASGQKVRLTGHTDNKGRPGRNLRLGERRAKSIRGILRSKGVKRDQIITESKGDTEPASTNETEEGRHQNRRVVVEILD